MNEECVAVDAVGSVPKLQPRVRLQRNILRTQWQGRSETIDEYGRHMESVAEVPEEASGLHQPRFWIRVLLLDRLPAKANEPCLPIAQMLTLTYQLSLSDQLGLAGSP